MHTFFLAVAIVLTLLILLTLYRVVAGPTVLDRIVGLTVLGAKTTVLLLLIGLLFDDVGMFVDIALAYALLNFIAVLGATRFFLRRRSVNLEDEQTAKEEVR
ncbi:monovalent cation/H+ antiporter complex subunit F [Geoalkalibacter halelectricus]|uniref:Monovalent cation/H+ antiporter complex subunit F n=1 Tax=Geoalkalibacter halelectricus TaxID=2847045 RepID=A0ABY5ZQ13_9BACT|nr:monovalent cation/H+ antiporter complex subunit F [Geoalkalibacter halelectricus]MDO3378306.1 monovalent cation/H+ antiporter complex subunit F [Geoalkalibacter halelectricus]UWZ79311.1 monovalent cation/H+ antiporter complex subunit F [Geoalkalibacter halelectricus]